MLNIEEIKYIILGIRLLLSLYIFRKTHIIRNLIIIEYLVILMILTIFLILTNIKIENFIVLYLLIITISERIIGLSILISIIRTHSNDFIKSTTIIKF